MPRTVKRLYDLEIDEISLVDASANQHAAFVFAKADHSAPTTLRDPLEETMPDVLYDIETGYEVFPDELQIGDVVQDSEGTRFDVVPNSPDDGSTSVLDGSEEDYD